MIDLKNSKGNVKTEMCYTYYQTAGMCDFETLLQTDYVKLCVTMASHDFLDRILSFTNSNVKKDVVIDLSAAQDLGNFFTDGNYDGQLHNDVILRKEDGEVWKFGLLPGLPYVFPSRDWNKYLADTAIKALDYGIKGVTLQEIGVFGDSGYEKSFREEWERFYNTQWPKDLWSNPGYYFMGQHLRNEMSKKQVYYVFSEIKNRNPKIKTTIANHTSFAYYPFKNSSGNHDLAALDVVDSIEGQTWSNTMELSFKYNGCYQVLPFVTGLFEYSYWANLSKQFPGKEVSVITDPKGDGYDDKTLQECKNLYEHQIVSQLAFNNIFKFNVCVWPDRAYSSGYDGKPLSTEGYRTVINNIVSIQNRMHNYKDPVLTMNRDINIGIMLLDTACYQAGGPCGGADIDDLSGLFSGLIMKGLIVEAIPFGESESEEDILNNYQIIIVSYDTMKPLSSLCNEKLQKYIESGGIVFYIGGKGEYEELDFSWWKKMGIPSPQDELLNRLDIFASDRIKNLCEPICEKCESWFTENIGDILPGDNGVLGYKTVNGANHLYLCNEKVVSFEKSYGKGHFIYFGVDPQYFNDKGNGDLLFKFVQNISKEKLLIELAEHTNIHYRRGPFLGYSALCNDVTSENGKFINLFDEKLSLIDNIKIKCGQSALLMDVSKILKSNKPEIIFTQGANPEIIDKNGEITINTAGPENTIGTVLVYIPDGQQISEVCIRNSNQENVLVSKDFDKQKNTLLITYRNSVQGVTIFVSYKLEAINPKATMRCKK